MDNQSDGPYAPQDVPPFWLITTAMCALDVAADVPSSFFAAYLLN